MPTQVDGALMHAMSGNELSRVRTEFRLRPPEPIKQSLLESRKPTLLCNQVQSQYLKFPVTALTRSVEAWDYSGNPKRTRSSRQCRMVKIPP
jgi:hypothetical protein